MTESSAAPKRGRLIAFRVFTILGAVLGASGLTFIALSIVSEPESIHRFHSFASGLPSLTFGTIALIAAVRRPAGAVASFRVWLSLSVAFIAGGLIGGDLLPSGYLVLPVLALFTYALHPARTAVNRCIKASVPLLAMGAAALVPAFIYALPQGDLQHIDPSSPHGLQHHYSGMAAAALSIGLAAIAASFPGTGERFARWLVGVTAALIGLWAALFPTYPGAWASPWSYIAIVWGIGFIALSTRKDTTEESASGEGAELTTPEVS